MKKVLLLASTAFLLSTHSFADCRRDTVNGFNIYNSVTTRDARWVNTFDSRGNQLVELFQGYSANTFTNIKLTTKTYNANNKVLSSLEQNFDAGTSGWVNSTKYEISYTGSNIADSITSTWDAGTSAWTANTRKAYTYDANGNETQIENFNWTSGAWQPSTKQVKTYNASNKLLTFTPQAYDQGTSTYVNYSDQLSYTYDGNGNETQKETSPWNGSAFVANQRETKSWSNGRLTQTSLQRFLGSWTTVLSSSLTYNDSSLVSEVLTSTRQGTQGGGSALLPESKSTLSYNTQNLLTRQDNFNNYNSQTAQYTPTSSEVRQYTASGKLSRLVYSNFSQGQGMVPRQEFLYEFNANDDLIATNERNQFNTANGLWNSDVRKEFVCGTSLPSGIEGISQIKFAMYPNPTTDIVTLELNDNVAKVAITDMLGKVIFEQVEATGKTVIATGNFSTGMYLVTIESNNQKATQRLVINK